MNNRPLVASGCYEVITPNHLLGGGNPNYDSDFTGLDRDAVKEAVLRQMNDLPHLFRQTQERLACFWESLWDQYLVSLRFSKDKMGNRFKMLPKVGDVCIVWKDKDPRHKWRKAVIKELMDSSDGQTRQVKIAIGDREQVRPVNQLYSLELTAEKYLGDPNIAEPPVQAGAPDGLVSKTAAKKRKQVKPIPVPIVRPIRAAAQEAMETRSLVFISHMSSC